MGALALIRFHVAPLSELHSSLTKVLRKLGADHTMFCDCPEYQVSPPLGTANKGVGSPIVNTELLWSTMALLLKSITLKRQLVLTVFGTCQGNEPVLEG